jgi:hypothetical protein
MIKIVLKVITATNRGEAKKAKRAKKASILEYLPFFPSSLFAMSQRRADILL